MIDVRLTRTKSRALLVGNTRRAIMHFEDEPFYSLPTMMDNGSLHKPTFDD
jgi:hypothetical protein